LKPLNSLASVAFVDAAPAAAEVSFAADEENFAGRFRDALRRRLFPHTNLQPKQIAHALGKSERAIQLIMAGTNGVNGATAAAAIRFFWSVVDRGFVSEIYALPLLTPVEEARKPLAEAHALLGAILQREVA